LSVILRLKILCPNTRIIWTDMLWINWHGAKTRACADLAKIEQIRK